MKGENVAPNTVDAATSSSGMDSILQRLAPLIRWTDERLDLLLLALRPESLRAHLRRNAQGYFEALIGIALASLVIALVNQVMQASNISLVYLLVVLYLATRHGRGPAILASILAFLAYDFFFIPPTLRFTVDDPSEWLSLVVLLITALVISQLTAAVRQRATEAMESRRQIAMLYEFAEVIASTTDRRELLNALAQHVFEVFRSDGVVACAIILPDALGWPSVQASAPVDHPALAAFDLQDRALAANASYVLRTGSSLSATIQVATQEGTQRADSLFLPLRSGKRTVGVLGIVGNDAVRYLTGMQSTSPETTEISESSGDAEAVGNPSAQVVNLAPSQASQARLFLAFRDQIALALERDTLRQEAIHAEALRESDKLKNALLGSVTHDLRTPLAAIKAAASSLLQPGVAWSNEDERDLLESIDVSADRLNRLVSNLLDLSRLEAGVATPQKEWYAFQDVLAAVLDRLDLSGQTRNRTVTVDIPDDLPLTPMDHNQIEQVLTNLIENALKYSPKETPIEIRARTLDDPRRLEVRVVDHGIGVPVNERRAIFDKFYRVQQARLPWDPKHPPLGTGLGLAISSSVVRAHSGNIWVEATAGGGATFIFTLPNPTEQSESAHRHGELQSELQAEPAGVVSTSTSSPSGTENVGSSHG
jgi:two-component system sensor histidine kinase KdpD